MPSIFFRSSKPVFINPESVIEGFRQITLELCRKNKNVKTVYLFGSYAQGNAGPHSDADILVVLFTDTRSLIDRLEPIRILIVEKEEHLLEPRQGVRTTA